MADLPPGPPADPSDPPRVRARDHLVWAAVLVALFAGILLVAAVLPHEGNGTVPDEPWKLAGTETSGPGVSLASGR